MKVSPLVAFVFVPITTLVAANTAAVVFCLEPIGNGGPFSGLDPVDWSALLLASALIVGQILAEVFKHVMSIPRIARRCIPWLYRFAQACPVKSHRRLWMENQILKAGRDGLGLKRARSAKRVVEDVIADRERARGEQETGLVWVKDPANDNRVPKARARRNRRRRAA